MGNRSRVIALTAAAVCVTALALTGCSGGDAPTPEGSTGPVELTMVRIGITPNANAAPVYVGIDQGIFEKYGLEVEPRTLQNGPESIQTLMAGELEVAFSGYFSAAQAISRGLPIQVVVNNDHEATTLDEAWASVTLVAKDSPIKSVSDLEGKTLGLNALKGQAEAQNAASFAAQGADFSKVELLEVPVPEMGAALANGSVDAINLSEPFVTAALDNGARIIDAPFISMSPDGGHFPDAGWVMQNSYVEANPELTERIVDALKESIDYTQAHPDAARSAIQQFTALTTDQLEAIRLPYWSTDINEKLMTIILDLAEERGILEKQVTLDELLAPTARESS